MTARSLSLQRVSSACRVGSQGPLHRSRATRTSTWGLVLIPAAAIVLGAPAFAAQTDITISTAAAPATPRINGPTILGATPASPFLYAIPATGQAPLTFAATGLPSGLTIDSTTGIISGTTPAAGSYPINLTVTNSSGSASATLTLTAGSTLALTPPMGWNSYDSFDSNVKQSDMETQSKAVKSLLQPYGWNTVVIDYRWYDPEDNLDADGRYLPSPSKYPSATGSDGFKTLAGEVQAQGLLFGIHLMRGIPKTAVSKNTPIANSTYKAADAANTSDTCSWDTHMYGVKGDTAAGQAWYDSIYQQYADWGVDFAKVDDMMNPYGGNVLHTSEVVAVHNSIVKTGRSMILSLSPGPNQTKDVATLNANANMWRQVNDFWDTNGLSSISDEFTAALSWSKTSGITPGHWPDADMLPLGTIGSRQCAFSHNQQVQVMTLWAIMPSPLIFGGLPSKLSGDNWTLPLLTNEEVLAVNQDAQGARGKQITSSGSTEVWAKDLSGGRKAVALFNRGTDDATVSVTFSQLGVTGTPAVRDCWHRADATGMTSGISVNVPHDGALMYVVGGTGGTGGSGGTTGTGGASGTGGAGGGLGSGGAGGGTGGATGRGGASGSGGSTSSGGMTGSGGAAGGVTAAGGAGSGGVTGRGGSTGSGAGGATAAGGSGGQSSSGGTAARGGSTGTPAQAGASGTGGAMASGGSTSSTSSGSGGATVPGTGGTPTSGAGGASPAGGNSGKAATAESGCSCALGSRGGSPAWLVVLLPAALLAARSRRRKAR